MTSLDLIKDLYKPYRITKKSKCTIIESMDGTFVIKDKCDKDLKSIFNYLDSRDFYNHPVLVDNTRGDIDLFEYVEDTDYPIEQKSVDMIKTVASLHSKTCYSKEVTEDKYKEIYENIKNNIDFYKKEYSKYADTFENEVFMSPSHYLFMRNISKLNNQIIFCEKELNKWYESIKNKKEIRVCTLHGNLSLSHFLKKEKEVLISWNHTVQDTPVLDLYNFFIDEGININSKSLLSSYLDCFHLDDEELKLLFILLAMPRKIEFTHDEFSSCKNLSNILDSIYKTEELIRPYYLIDDEVQKE